MQHVADVAQVDSPAFWKQPFRVPAASDPYEATAQTIRIMCGHIKDGAGDDAVRQAAADAVARFGGMAGLSVSDDAMVAGAAWWWCKTFIKFVHHDFIIRQKLGESGHLQGLIAPEVLVRMKQPEGDCAIFTECLCAFLRVLGIPYELVTVAVNPNEPEIFSHVYLYAIMPDGTRLPLDASHGDYPGWQVPSSHVSRRQVWDADGNPVADRASRFDGLHNYGLRGGLGTWVQDAFDGTWYDDGTATNQQPATSGADTATDFLTAGAWPSAGVQVPNQNSAQWVSFATALSKMGFSLAQQNALKPGQVILPNGTILQQAPGLAVPFGAQLSQAFSGASGNTMIYLLVGGAALLLMSGSGKR